MSYLVKCLASLIVSGNFLLSVSGRSSDEAPARKIKMPHTSKGASLPRTPPVSAPYGIKYIFSDLTKLNHLYSINPIFHTLINSVEP